MNIFHYIACKAVFSKGYSKECVCLLSHFHHVQLFVSLWTVACWAPLSRWFSNQESWQGLLCPSPGDLPQPGIEPTFLTSPALAGGFFTTSATCEARSKEHFIHNRLMYEEVLPFTYELWWPSNWFKICILNKLVSVTCKSYPRQKEKIEALSRKGNIFLS